MSLSQLSLSVHAASHVLGLNRGRFISEVESKDIVHDLQHENIITKGVLDDIQKESDKTLQNKKLYAYLEQTSTKDSLMAACNIMIAVAIHGNPNMKQFGEDLKRLVEGEWLCVRTCKHSACMCLVFRSLSTLVSISLRKLLCNRQPTSTVV